MLRTLHQKESSTDIRGGQVLGALRLAAILGVICLLGAALRFWGLDRLPPGLYHDEAFNGLTALRILEARDWQPFYASNSGREGAFFYLLALAVKLGGPTVLALRSVSALIGVLTIPLVFVVARQLFYEERQRATWIGLLGAAALATSYWHLNFSRTVLRAILLPPFTLLTLGCLAYAWRTRRLWAYFWTGVALGLTMYTYLAARLLPVVIALFVAWEGLLAWREQRRARRGGTPDPSHAGLTAFPVAGLALMVAAAVLTVTPLLWYFFDHPGTFTGRLRAASALTLGGSPDIGGSLALRLLDNFTKTVRLLYDRGDPNPLHGIPFRPALDLLGAILFTIGLGSVLQRPGSAGRRMLLLWLGVMLLPVALSTETPNSLRGLGALPAACLFIGVGGAWVADRLAAVWVRVSGTARATFDVWAGLLLMAIVIASGSATAISYFIYWPRLSTTAPAFDSRWRDTAEAIRQTTATSDLYLPMELFTRSTVRYLLHDRYANLVTPGDPVDPGSLRSPQIMYLTERSPLGPFVLLTGGTQPVARSLQPLARTDWLALAGSLKSRSASASGVVNAETVDRAIFLQLSPDELRRLPRVNAPAFSLPRCFANQVCLLGYSIEPDVATPGGVFQVTLFWRAERLLDDSVAAFVHLVDRAGRVRAQDNDEIARNYYPGAMWSTGEIVPDVRILPTTQDMDAGKVRFEVGLTQGGRQERVPIVDAQGRAVADQVQFGAATVRPAAGAPVAQPPAPAHPLGITFGPAVRLFGYDLKAGAQPGGSIDLALYWQALTRLDNDYSIFVHLVDPASGAILAQADHQPQEGRNPTSWWVPGEQVVDRVTLPVPEGASPPYHVNIGLYTLSDGKRLMLQRPAGETEEDHISLVIP